MDTLTQITLGAAVGEAVLGKKIGNRAMAWGAFGALIPDLDVAANLFTDEIHALAFHRGLMHSLPFAVVAAIGLGWLVAWLYERGHYRRNWFKISIFSFIVFLLMTMAGAANYVVYTPQDGANIPLAVGSAGAVGGLAVWIWKRFFQKEWTPVSVSWQSWAWLFWWSISTHIALDCFTSYGTQIFQPFTNYAVAFSTVSVIDPLYTMPFLACVVAVLFLQKNTRRRRMVNWLGIGLSSAYLLFTVYHKWQVDRIFEDALHREGIVAERFTTSPTMFNNYLWQGVAENGEGYYHATFSLFDPPPKIQTFNFLPKNHDLMASYEDNEVMHILKWFPNGFYNVLEIDECRWQLNDLRYGCTGDAFTSREDFAFRFIIEEKDGKLRVHQKRAYHHFSWEMLEKLFDRMRGRPVKD